jgi:hypothetical protein
VYHFKKQKLSTFQANHRFLHFIDMALFLRPPEVPFYRYGVPFYRGLLWFVGALHSIEMEFHTIDVPLPAHHRATKEWRPPFLLNSKGAFNDIYWKAHRLLVWKSKGRKWKKMPEMLPALTTRCSTKILFGMRLPVAFEIPDVDAYTASLHGHAISSIQ